jgi:hypothetical protein
METTTPQRFADLPTSPAYPTYVKPEPVDVPTRHRKTYTFVRSIMDAWDTLVDAAVTAAYCHSPMTAPADALDQLGETYGGLARAIIDDDTSYRAYLRGPLDRWYRFGTRAGLLGELAHIGYPNAEIVSWVDLVDAGAAPPNVVFGGNTTFFFVAIYMPNPFSALLPKWNDGSSVWGDGQTVWGGGTSSADRVAELQRVIALVKPAHTSCRHIVAFLDSTSGLNAQKLPTGNYVVFPMNEPWERIRPTYAINPYYTQNPLVP